MVNSGRATQEAFYSGSYSKISNSLLSSEVSEMKVLFHFRASDDNKRVNTSRLVSRTRRVQGLPWGINTSFIFLTVVLIAWKV